jgi:uncharacterized protein YwgA
MKPMQRYSVLLSLMNHLRLRGSWCGETHVQKTGYFVQELLGVPLGFEFIFYKHGPYSFDLTDELTAMTADQVLGVRAREPYGPTLVATEGGQRLIDRHPVTLKHYDPPLRFITDRLSRKNVNELEQVATALYVTKEGKTDGSVGQRAARIHLLKPHIMLVDAQEAVKAVDRIIADAEQFRHTWSPPTISD